MFDRVLLLSGGGETVYFGDIGPDASTLISYFESNGAPKCEVDANPAEWVLDVTSVAPRYSPDELVERQASPEPKATSPSRTATWSEKWKASREKKEVANSLGDIKPPVQATPIQQYRDEYVTSWYRQLVIVCKRLFQEYWRSPTYVYSKIALCAGVVSSGFNTCPRMDE